MIDAVGATFRAEGAEGDGAGSDRVGLTALADEDTFLKLLIAQVQNQDPLNPQEPIQFVTQLAQFSQLETMLGMRDSLEAIEQSLASAADPAGAEEADPAGGA